jgi:hypothetical protein
MSEYFRPFNDATANPRQLTSAEINEGSVPCPCCGEPHVRPSIKYGNLLREFECFSCGAIWLGDRRGAVLKFKDDFCSGSVIAGH